MSKILSSLLAALLVVGLSSGALAADNQPGDLRFQKLIKSVGVRLRNACMAPPHEGMVPKYVRKEYQQRCPTTGILPGEPPPRSDPKRAGLRHSLARSIRDIGARLGLIKGSRMLRTVFDANKGYSTPSTPELSDEPRDFESGVKQAKSVFRVMKDFCEVNTDLGFDAMRIVSPGTAIRSIVRYGRDYNNAFWNGREATFGSGDQIHFNDFTTADDVCSHELGHGMTERVLNLRPTIKVKVGEGKTGIKQTAVAAALGIKAGIERAFRAIRVRASLIYRGQSGALNESISDIYGVMTNHYAKGKKISELTEQDWLIGEGLLKDVMNEGRPYVSLRNMANPGTAFNDAGFGRDRQPAHMKDLYTGTEDNGGVHINSGIPNKAYVTAATLYAKKNPEAVEWKTIGRVWLGAFSRVGKNASFQEAAEAIYQNALEHYPNDPTMANAIVEGWRQVGLSINTAKAQSRAQNNLRRGLQYVPVGAL